MNIFSKHCKVEGLNHPECNSSGQNELAVMLAMNYISYCVTEVIFRMRCMYIMYTSDIFTDKAAIFSCEAFGEEPVKGLERLLGMGDGE